MTGVRIAGFLFFLGCLPLHAAAPSPCQTAWARVPALKALEPWRTKAIAPEDFKTWDGWSSDLLLHLALVLRQDVIPRCSGELSSVADGLEMAYLRKLGLGELLAEDRPAAFRAFLATREDHPALVHKLKASTGTALDRAKQVYGWASVFRGTVVVASKPVPLDGLEATLKSVCPKACVFWDPAFLYKVLVTDHGGLAAYVPETASLVVSRSLVESATPIHRLILIHELAHAVSRGAEARGDHWDAEFAAFSGWSTKGLEPEVWANRRGDALSKAATDGFSLDPDPVIGAMKAGKKRFEGFPLGRTATRVASSGDFSEDLADAAAAYAVAPERFCFGAKPLAPGKFRWIGERLFGVKKSLTCAKAKLRKK